MTTSSQPKGYSITSNDIISIDAESFNPLSIDLSTISIDSSLINSTGSSYNYPASTGIYTISVTGAGGGGAIGSGGTVNTTSSINLNTTFNVNVFNESEWKTRFPHWDRVQKMCEEYPGLKIAFDKFKTVYEMVKDHYDTPIDKRPKI